MRLPCFPREAERERDTETKREREAEAEREREAERYPRCYVTQRPPPTHTPPPLLGVRLVVVHSIDLLQAEGRRLEQLEALHREKRELTTEILHVLGLRYVYVYAYVVAGGR